MSEHSRIEWTDATWNCIRGCVKVSDGCKNCYAERFAERFRGVAGHPYEQGFDLRLVPEKLEEPLKWKKPWRVFVNSMSDLFQVGAPFEFIDRMFAVMALASEHTYLILTKRPERMRDYIAASGRFSAVLIHAREIAGNYPVSSLKWVWPLPNVQLGVSVENRQTAAARIPLLLQTPAAVRFVSYEPALELVLFDRVIVDGESVVDALLGKKHTAGVRGGYTYDHPSLDWIIVGGESGPGARPFNVRWARSVVRQCKSAGVPCFVKQMGSYVVDRNDAGVKGDTPSKWPDELVREDRVADRTAGNQGVPVRIRLKDRKGGSMEEWPEDLRVREFPK